MNIRHLVLSIPFMAMGINVAAASTGFDSVLDTLVANNLEARLTLDRAHGAVESLKGENTLGPVEVEFGRVWGSNAEVGNKWNLSVSQGFDWPELYKARSEAAATATTALNYLRESTLLETRQQARLLLIDIIYNNQLINLQEGLVERMNQMEAYYRKASEAGLETRLDYNKTVVERIAVHRELHLLETRREALRASLEAFNGGKDVTTLYAMIGDEYPQVDPARQAEAIAKLRERDPQYAAAVAQSEAARSLVKVEKMNRLPGFSIGYVHETELGGNFDGFSIGVSLPVWSRKHSAKAAAIEADASLLEAEMNLTRRRAELEADGRQIATLRHIIDEYAPVVKNTSNFELLRKALDAGQINFLTYLEEVNFFITAHRDYLDTLYEYNLALARRQFYE